MIPFGKAAKNKIKFFTSLYLRSLIDNGGMELGSPLYKYLIDREIHKDASVSL